MEKTGIEYLLAINLVTFLTFALDNGKQYIINGG